MVQKVIFKFEIEMAQISSNVKGVSNNNSNNVHKKSFVESLTECFSEYLGNMFRDFGEVLEKRLGAQQVKIKQTELRLGLLMKRLDCRRSEQITSLASIQDEDSESNQVSRVKSLSVNSQMQQRKIHKVNEALKKLQQGIDYLEASLTCLKSKKSIQDPQMHPSTKSFNLQSLESQMKDQMQAMSKIQKLTSKISRFAKQSSIEQIQNQKQVRPHRIQKSRSLITLSSRRYHPVSCPKRYQYSGAFNLNNHIHLQAQTQSSLLNEYSNICPSQSTLNPKNNQSVLYHQNPNKSDQNKMPLINKSKTVLNQLLSMVNDQADANVVMFYLKKGFKTITEMTTRKDIIHKLNTLKKDHKDLPNNAQNQLKKQLNHNFSEYFSLKSNTLRPNNTTEHHKNGTSVCSINNTLPGSQNSTNGMSWIKQNYSSVNDPSQVPERGLFQKMNQNSESCLNPNLSRQKRKFQRTSNDQKMLLLKGKFRSNY